MDHTQFYARYDNSRREQAYIGVTSFWFGANIGIAGAMCWLTQYASASQCTRSLPQQQQQKKSCPKSTPGRCAPTSRVTDEVTESHSSSDSESDELLLDSDS